MAFSKSCSQLGEARGALGEARGELGEARGELGEARGFNPIRLVVRNLIFSKVNPPPTKVGGGLTANQGVT